MHNALVVVVYREFSSTTTIEPTIKLNYGLFVYEKALTGEI